MERHEDGAGGRSSIPRRQGGESVAASGKAVARATATDDRADMSIETPARPEERDQRPVGRGPGSHEGWLLAVCCVAQFMVILDLSIVNVALPTIQASLSFSSPDLQWVVNA